jgi:hypothetical protein
VAICTWCNAEMTVASSCSVKVFHRAGTAYPLPRYGAESRFGRRTRPFSRCGDCGVILGQFHHPGCDIAECPGCGRELLSCGCCYDEDDDNL